MRNILISLVFLGLFSSLFFEFEFNEKGFSKDTFADVQEGISVASVIDGDTIILENGEKVRYIGIDTPEYNFENKEVSECFSEEARKRNQELVEGKKVLLQKDVSERDGYGRLLRYVFVDGVFVNKLLLEEGYADTMSISPDGKYKKEFRQARENARELSIGMWKACYE